MKQLNKIGFLILVLIWPIGYFLKFINPISNQLIVDYIITFGTCLGTSILAFSKGFDEYNRKAKYLFYYAIVVFGIAIILTYLIDLIIDPIFGTTKVIWSIIITIITTLCIYMFSRKS